MGRDGTPPMTPSASSYPLEQWFSNCGLQSPWGVEGSLNRGHISGMLHTIYLHYDITAENYSYEVATTYIYGWGSAQRDDLY